MLAENIASLLPKNTQILDVGCGDGSLDSLIIKQQQVNIKGIDVLLRKQTHIPVKLFDGTTIPYEDNSFDTVVFVDVLHHTESPQVLLKEAKRVARFSIILKDHLTDGLFATSTLRFMDWVGNAHHGVVLPYNYYSKHQWNNTFEKLGLTIANWKSNLNLYPLPSHWFFDRNLHFIAKLYVNK
ncbi:MAG: class I SAM-dependent methyltransferase [Bacteroidales bacterium]|nr:class I SAM-dependent methyltransferase [Bacteroidales bacterium]